METKNLGNWKNARFSHKETPSKVPEILHPCYKIYKIRILKKHIMIQNTIGNAEEMYNGPDRIQPFSRLSFIY